MDAAWFIGGHVATLGSRGVLHGNVYFSEEEARVALASYGLDRDKSDYALKTGLYDFHVRPENTGWLAVVSLWCIIKPRKEMRKLAQTHNGGQWYVHEVFD